MKNMSENALISSKEVAKFLKKVREKAGLSQSEVAKRIGMSPKSGYSYISHLETGIKKNPSLITVLRYLRACGASWTDTAPFSRTG